MFSRLIFLPLLIGLIAPAHAQLTGLSLVVDASRQMTALRMAGDPAVAAAVSAFNAGKPATAETYFMAVTDEEIRAAGVAYAVGHLYYEEHEADCQRAGAMLIALAGAQPQFSAYGTLGGYFSNFTLSRASISPNGEAAAGSVLAMGESGNPFYDKAKFYKARYLRAHAQESGTSQSVPNQMFAELKVLYSLQPSLRELTGEKILWGENLIDDTSNAPAWARYIRELYARQAAVLHWWFNERQLPNGELGGGIGDDVEILRDWGPFAAISNGDPTLVEGITRLCEVTWDLELAQYGFAELGDVEHSSEPSADTLPTMMVLNWGDPLWIERNMRSARQIRDVYMGIDNKGYYRFKSAWFGDSRVGSIAQGGDNAMCTRPMKHFQHLALWGNAEAERVFLNWIDGWFAITMQQLSDKPSGITPRSIFYPSGDIVSPYCQPWYADCHYFYGGPTMSPYMLSAFLNAYLLKGGRDYLEPYQRYLHWESFGPLIPDNSPGTPGTAHWVIYHQQHTGNFDHLAMFRWISGDRTSDEYVLRFARPTQRYYVDNDLETYIASIETKAKALRYNFRLKTLEQLQTDRAGLDGSAEAFGAYTGGLFNWRESLIPSMSVTWEAPDTDFAALVTVAETDHVRAWVYSFHDAPITVGMRFWRLQPGRYACSYGQIHPGEQTNLRYQWTPNNPFDPYFTFEYRRTLDTYTVEIPPRKPIAIDVRLVEPINVPRLLPDPALTDADITRQGDTISVKVHNIGGASCEGVTVVLQGGNATSWRDLDSLTTGLLPAPDLSPVTQTLVFQNVESESNYRVVLDPGNHLLERMETNNIGFLQDGPAEPTINIR